jgi:hypothetical protein
MKHLTSQHPYKHGIDGRHTSKRIEQGQVIHYAYLACVDCGEYSEEIRLKADLPPEVLDKKFQAKGWTLDPTTCPTCQEADRAATRAKKEAKTMASMTIEPEVKTPSTTAIKMQLQMMRLLDEHFDADAGAFDAGWSDERVAKETGLALSVVTSFRREGYGEIKRPPELVALGRDIDSLAELQKEQAASVLTALNELRQRLSALEKTWPR